MTITPYRPAATIITVKTTIPAPISIDTIWAAYTTPSDIKQWNAASSDWHTTQSTVDLRLGGLFSSRMEAKDGSFGFDFSGTYTQIVLHELLAFSFGERQASVTFTPNDQGITVSVSFDAEHEHPAEYQKQGWQAILNNFSQYVINK
jgi:uncharacterized protein YndB with AHSA1/START domain